MYTFNSQNGTIVRVSDGKIIAPCESPTDPDFLAYLDWVNQGNQPITI